MLITLAASVILAAGAVASHSEAAPAHQERVEHRGAAYDVHYSPRLTTSSKTIGAVAGTRPSTQRCRWTVNVDVERAIRKPDGSVPLTRMLSAGDSFSGEVAGACAHNSRAIRNAQAGQQDRIQQIVRTAATADRAHVTAEIDTVQALASN